MGLILICVIVIILAQLYKHFFESGWDSGGFITTVLTVLILVCLLIAACTINIADKTEKIDYAIEMNYFNSLKNSKKLTSTERIKAVRRIIKINKNIEGAKIWKNNFWIGLYVTPTTAELKPIDINIIPQATYDVKLNR